MTSLVRNILSQCAALQKAVTDYNRLPESEQEQVWSDLAGLEAKNRLFYQGKELPASAEANEPAALVNESLLKLDLELLRMSLDEKLAYTKALEASPDYVRNRAFRLKFLRAEKFNVSLAASRIAQHFEEKLQLFGEDVLGREIFLSDLDEDDMAALTTGYLQVLPQMDANNRKVLFYYKAISNCYKRRENMLKAYWYVTNAISYEEHVQKLGIVNLVYNVGGFPKNGMDYEKSRRFSRLMRAVPLRFNSIFVCLDETAWVTVVDTFSVLISRYLRIRLRMIFGNHSAVQDKLEKVGIPSKALPIDAEKNELLLDAHLKWIESQRIKEEETMNPPFLASEQTENRHVKEDILGGFYHETVG